MMYRTCTHAMTSLLHADDGEYRIAPNFRGTKFSQIGLLQNDFSRLRVLVSHAQSDAAAATTCI